MDTYIYREETNTIVFTMKWQFHSCISFAQYPRPKILMKWPKMSKKF